MHKGKKTLSLLLATVMVLGAVLLTGCQSQDPVPTTAPTEPPTADPTVPSTVPSGTAAPGKSGDDSFMLWLWTMIVLAVIFTALVIFVIIKKRKGKAAE